MDFNIYSISKIGFIFNKYEIEFNGKIIYTVKRKGFSFLSRYGFYDNFGTEVYLLKRKSAFFKLHYQLLRDERYYADISQTKGMFKNNFIVESATSSYYVEGGFMMKEFTVFENETEVAKISRKPFSRKDKYGIAIKSNANQDLILALTIAIEITRKVKQARNSS